MRFLNGRVVAFALLLLLTAVAAFIAFAWWRDRTAYLESAARDFAARGESALQAGDTSAARRNFDYAEMYLHRLLERRPDDSALWMQRWRALRYLASLAPPPADAKAAGLATAEDLSRRALRCLGRAADDPLCAEAQAELLDLCFKTDDLDRGMQPARRLLARLDRFPADFPGRNKYLLGAHFILARDAMQQDPPRTDEALDHLRQAAVLEGQGGAPRWRVLGLEARALFHQVGGVRNSANREQAERLRRSLAAWLRRATEEADRSLPASDDLPERSAVAELSVSDSRGLLEVLLVAVDFAGNWEEFGPRFELLLTVCERMNAVPKPRTVVAAASTRALTHATNALSTHAGGSVPGADVVSKIARRTAIRLSAAVAKSTVDPRSFLNLARLCRRREALDQAAWIARVGLALPGLEARGPTARLDLNTELAWDLLLQGKTVQAEEPLAVLRRETAFAGTVHLMLGLAAAQDGRLELASTELKLAEKDARFADSALIALVQGQVSLALGNPAEALPRLQRLKQALPALRSRAKEDSPLRDFLPEPHTLELQLYRCHLALGRDEDAAACRQRLRGTPLERSATLDFINAHIARARAATDAAQAQRWWQTAGDELRVARERYPTEGRLILAEVEWLTARPSEDALTRAAAVLALVSPSPSPTLAALYARHLVQAFSENADNAERLLREHAVARRNAPTELRVAWVVWLLRRERHEEAIAALDRFLADAPPQHRRPLQLFRARLLLEQGQTPELARFLGDMERAGPGPETDLFRALYLLEVEQNAVGARRAVAESLTRHEGDGMLALWQARLAQAEGDYSAAVSGYERALDYPALKPAARAGLYGSLLAQVESTSAEAVYCEAVRLLRAHPGDVALLLVVAETALRLDRVNGPDGMLAAVATLNQALARDKFDPAWGPYLTARLWQNAGRTDLARRELDQALKPDTAAHVPTLRLALQLAFNDGDWQASARHAERLARVAPELPQPAWAAALAWERRRDWTQARQAFEELTRRHPDFAEGYLGVARTHVGEGKAELALPWVERCRERCPDHLPAVRAQVRLLCLLGRTQEAQSLGERLSAEERPTKAAPAGTPRQLALRQEAARQARADRQELIALHAAQGFADAGRIAEAQAWLRRAVTSAEGRPEKERKAAVARAQAWRGEILMTAGLARTDNGRRASLMLAAEAYRAAHAANPDDVGVANNLAYLLSQELGDNDGACAVAERIRRPRSDRPAVSGERLSLDVLDTLGLVYRAASRHEDHARLFEEAARRYGNEPIVQLHLGRAYSGLRDAERAAACFRRGGSAARERARAAATEEEANRWERLAAECAREGRTARRD